MANGKYDAARDAFGAGALSWTGDKIVAQLVSREYVFDARHKDVRSIKGALGAALVLTEKSIAAGWVKCATLLFPQVTGDGKQDAVAIVFRRESSEASRATLIEYHDDIEHFPMKPNGGDIEVATPAPGWFRV